MSNLPFFHLVRKSNLKNNKSPLLLMIHGYGSNEQDLFSFSRAIPENFTIVSLRGDIEIQYNGYAWYNISIDYNYTNSIAGYLRINNILNSKEEMWRGYREIGLNAWLGLSYSF